MNIESVGQEIIKTLTPVSEQETIRATTSSDVSVQTKKALNTAILNSAVDLSLKSGNEPMSLILQSVLEGINESLQLIGTDKQIETGYELGLELTPEGAAEKIVSASTGFLSRFMQQNSELSAQEMRDSFAVMINAGIDKGLAEARGVLESLGVLNSQVVNDIETFYGTLENKLAYF